MKEWLVDLYCDYRDRRAQPKPSRGIVHEVQAGFAALVSLASSFSELVKYAAGTVLAPLVTAILSIIFWMASFYVISAKDEAPATVLTSTFERPPLVYRFARSLRRTSKVLSVLLLPLVVLNVHRALPNVVTGMAQVSGYICSDTGVPIAGANVRALDRSENEVSVRSERTDMRGYFVLDLEPFAYTAFKLEIRRDKCAAVVRIAEASFSEGACGRSGSSSYAANVDGQECAASRSP